MKKFVAVVALCLFLFPASNAIAGFHLDDENLSISNYLDFKTSDILLGGCLSVFDIANIVSFDLGLISPGNGVALSGGLSLNIPEVCTKFGWRYNLPEPIKFGGFYAKDFITQRELYGINFGIIWQLAK